MQFLSEWSTLDRRRFVILETSVLTTFWKHRQNQFWKPESGGILLGRRRGKHLEVIAATEPTSHDRRGRFSLKRAATGHAQAAHQAWLQGNGQVDYLGEWHTHPQSRPGPSTLDRDEWGKLVARRRAKPHLMIIVGTNELYVEILTRDSSAQLAPT